MKDNITKRVALAGMLTALAMIFSYIEAIMPFSIGIYGVKLGLANLVVLSGLYYLPHRDVFLVSVTRIFLSTLLFGKYNGTCLQSGGGNTKLSCHVRTAEERYHVHGWSQYGRWNLP